MKGDCVYLDVEQSIRQILLNYMRSKKMNYAQFSAFSGINSGSLSRILQGSRPISVRQLELITGALGLEEDALFDLYVEECFAFSHRCVEYVRLLSSVRF